MHTQPLELEVIDPTTRAGFLAIAEAFGRDRAHESRIAAYAELYERDKDFRWHGLKWQRAMQRSEFERSWERDNPRDACLLREAGITY